MKLLSFLFLLGVATLATAGACNSGINAIAVPLLKGYPPAQSFCSAKYPQPVVSVTFKDKRGYIRTSSTTTTTRHSSSTTTTTTRLPSTTPTTSRSATTTQDAKASQWSVLVSEAGAALSTFCSCIETPSTKTVTPMTTTTTTTTTTTSTIPTTTTSTLACVPQGGVCNGNNECCQTPMQFCFGASIGAVYTCNTPEPTSLKKRDVPATSMIRGRKYG
ncbi:hypothetical protein Z517_02024 [Fonsecaea pedrosoi CBS 271.37]|uniref:Hydrophobin n=1 Tax=Fonsecaea pedrosoi CBS 271.37 TaxID=1442368 RepID=A0A0D2DY77_9EURO|nr:uncharacterized protein Z517_02024 [Fonsecaea pedrosoi CBS 271.37]KIW82781.1 hypothetical protein Z517_02024 [Fonsecaea pedrosoi CBS 271.37]